jgi:hypothetical protein
MAYADGENMASQNVLTKVGFKKGRLFAKHYVLPSNAGSGKRSDLQCFYLDRPGSNSVKNDALLQKGPHEPTIREEDAASIRNTLRNDGIVRG